MDPAVSQALDRIPMLPGHIQALFAILNDPDGEIHDVAELVCRDPSLAAQSLRVCNSAFYSLPVVVTSVHQAVVLLGMDTVQGIALASYFQSALTERRGLPGGWLDGAGDHALIAAHLSRWFLQAVGEHLEAATAFTAGLIHDVGKLAFSHLDPDVERAVLTQVEGGAPWCAAERDVLGIDHAEAGGRVCERWEIPETLAQTVHYHHSPLESVDEPMACVVHIADRLAHASVTATGEESPLAGIEPAAWQALGLDDATMADLANDLLRTLEATPLPAG
ncbi:MAG: HDOD domain-containing protein [Nitrospirota bacterium]|jgi:HD-like signal output (HDOD) protein